VISSPRAKMRGDRLRKPVQPAIFCLHVWSTYCLASRTL
jgi:hypothetical protein